MITLLYGQGQTYLDITETARHRCRDAERVYIPHGDAVRASIFGDPVPGAVKEVVMITDGDTRTTFDAFTPVSFALPDEWRADPAPRRTVKQPPAHLQYISDRIDAVHRQLVFIGGSLRDELPEQTMAVRFIPPDARVLELGSNIGRNTLLIASLLDDDANLVTLECDPVAVELLRNNRYANGMGFRIEPSALSYRRLMQRGWETIPSDELRDGYRWVSTITFEELVAKYPIGFNTLVADCEGALYFILSDNDAMLAGIDTVILESDYLTADHKHSVEEIFARYGLRRVHSESLKPDFDHHFPPECLASFFEVWQRD